MNRTALIATLAAATAFASVPAAAGDDRRGGPRFEQRGDHRDWRGDWRDNRRDSRDAWRAGYRAGQQAARDRHQRDTRNWNNSGWNNSGWNSYPASSRGWVEGRDWWQGNDGRYYCRRSDGTTGTIVGAVAGGTLGNILAGQGDKRLGAVIGGTLGAVVGRAIDRGEARCR